MRYANEEVHVSCCSRFSALLESVGVETAFITTASPTYRTPIAAAANGTVMTIKAIAAKPEMSDSEVAQAIYAIHYPGALDTGFLATGTGANGYVGSIVVQSDGKILIGGDFTTYNGTSRGYVARLWN